MKAFHHLNSTNLTRLGNPSLCSAVQTLFVEKKVKTDLGEFSRILLLHGIYHEISQVKAYYKRPLSTWTPSAQTVGQSAAALDHSEKRWLSDVATFASWRNAALDCVDALHWGAEGMAALARAEHPTVLHLHLARTVLLVPHQEILTLAHAAAARSPKCQGLQVPTRDEAVEAEREVLKWAQRDEVSCLDKKPKRDASLRLGKHIVKS